MLSLWWTVDFVARLHLVGYFYWITLWCTDPLIFKKNELMCHGGIGSLDFWLVHPVVFTVYFHVNDFDFSFPFCFSSRCSHFHVSDWNIWLWAFSDWVQPFSCTVLIKTNCILVYSSQFCDILKSDDPLLLCCHVDPQTFEIWSTNLDQLAPSCKLNLTPCMFGLSSSLHFC